MQISESAFQWCFSRSFRCWCSRKRAGFWGDGNVAGLRSDGSLRPCAAIDICRKPNCKIEVTTLGDPLSHFEHDTILRWHLLVTPTLNCSVLLWIEKRLVCIVWCLTRLHNIMKFRRYGGVPRSHLKKRALQDSTSWLFEIKKWVALRSLLRSKFDGFISGNFRLIILYTGCAMWYLIQHD